MTGSCCAGDARGSGSRAGAVSIGGVHAAPRPLPESVTDALHACSTRSAREALHPLRRGAPVTSRYTRYVALHPLRRDTPDQKGCNAYGSGAPPPTTSTTADNSSPQTPTVHLGRCDTASTCSPGSEREALHPLRRDAPDQKGCNAYGSGAPPHRHQACAQVASLTLHMLASNRPRPRSAALDTTAMQFSGD